MTTPNEVDPQEFRRWMARFATGVTVVTAQERRAPFGLTVNAFLSVALRPPMVLISLTLDADTTPVVQRTRQFAVNLLAARQRPLSKRFARTIPPAEKFRNVDFRLSESGLPVLAGTLGAIECTVEEEYAVADHVLFVGRVRHVTFGRTAPPLVFHEGDYFSTGGLRRHPVPPTKR